MFSSALHSWEFTFKEAVLLQKKLSRRLILDQILPTCHHVAAVDVSHNQGDDRLHAVALIYDISTESVIEKKSASARAKFPYIPGYLSFRELPPILKAFALVQTPCQAVLVDGQGIAHPRGLGLASHLGLWLNMPTIGCAKSRLFGKYREPDLKRGSRSPLFSAHDGEIVGSVLRTRSFIKPIFISPGHLCDLDGAVELVLKLSGKTRLPTPSQLAHRFANQIRREAG